MYKLAEVLSALHTLSAHNILAVCSVHSCFVPCHEEDSSKKLVGTIKFSEGTKLPS